MRRSVLILGLLLATPAAAQTSADELARSHRFQLELLDGQISTLAKAKIALATIYRDHNALAAKAKHDQSLQAAASCSHEIDFDLAGAWLNIQSTQDLLSVASVMQTADDRQTVALVLSNHALETETAIQSLAGIAKAVARYCPADERELSALQAWAADSAPILDRIEETADAMSK
jgi:hypothetical protein